MELQDIKGIGPKRIALLHQLGIDSLSDLLTYYPSGYLDYSACTPVAELTDGEFATVRVTLTSGPSWFSRRGLTTITLYGRDEAGKRIALRFFNQPYRAKGLEPGQSFGACKSLYSGENAHSQDLRMASTSLQMSSLPSSLRISCLRPGYTLLLTWLYPRLRIKLTADEN